MARGAATASPSSRRARCRTTIADAAEIVSAAASYLGDHATEIVQECAQLHGGIGVTWEHDLHLYLRRVTLDRNLFGTPAQHR